MISYLLVVEQHRTQIVIHALFFFQAEDGIRDTEVTGVQTCALPIWFFLLRMSYMTLLLLLNIVIVPEYELSI